MGGIASACGRRPALAQAQKTKAEPPPGWAPLPDGYSHFNKVGCCGALSGDPKQTNYIYTLKQHLANWYYLTGGCGCLDYLLFVCNWHPLLGMILSHPNHPWSKAERVTMFLISLSITVVPAAWIASNHGLVAHGVARGKAATWLEEIHIPEQAYPYIFITLPDIVIGFVLYQLAIQETRNCCCCCGKAFHTFFECLKNILMIVCLVCGVAGTVFAHFLLKDGDPTTDWRDLLVPLGEGFAMSWCLWFVIWTLLPCELGFISNWRVGAPAVSWAESELLAAE